MSGCFFKIESEEGAWNTGTKYEHGNRLPSHRQGGYFPVPRLIPARTCARKCA